MHPGLLLLLKKICIIERLTPLDVVSLVVSPENRLPLDYSIGLFCANYFAQACTLQGHEAARHGEGRASIKTVSKSMEVNAKRYDLALNIANDCRISEDYEPYDGGQG